MTAGQRLSGLQCPENRGLATLFFARQLGHGLASGVAIGDLSFLAVIEGGGAANYEQSARDFSPRWRAFSRLKIQAPEGRVFGCWRGRGRSLWGQEEGIEAAQGNARQS
jgi:hypothetical protein